MNAEHISKRLERLEAYHSDTDPTSTPLFVKQCTDDELQRLDDLATRVVTNCEEATNAELLWFGELVRKYGGW